MLAPDFVSHTKLVAGQQPGREGEKWAIAQLTAALSNRSIHFEDQVAAGDKVVSRFTVHHTHDREGEMFGFPRLQALVAELGEGRSLGDSLLEELYSFVGEGWEQEDDITLLTLRRFSSLS